VTTVDSPTQQTSRKWQIGNEIRESCTAIDIKSDKDPFVYVVVDWKWRSIFALKAFQNIERLDLFINEAQIWVDLEKHTNIVFANFIDIIDEQPCIFLEYLEGGDLSQFVKQRLSITDAMDYAIQVCNGMNYAYQRNGIIHKDLNPKNIVITRHGIAKVTDFGIATAISKGRAQILSERHIRPAPEGESTPFYRAPEQFRKAIQTQYGFAGQYISTRSDIYSFGVIFYQLLTGRFPFQREVEILFDQKPVNPAVRNPAVPKQLDRLLMRCLEKYPSERYSSFSELGRELIDIYNSFLADQKAAGERFRILSKKERLSAEYLNNKGYSLAGLKKYREAIGCFDRALHIKPHFATAWINKGICHGILQHPRKAITCFNKAHKYGIEQQHEAFLALYFRGKVLKDLGKDQLANGCFTKALKVEPHYWLRNKGDELIKAGKYKEAIDYCKKILDIDPNDVGTLLSLGECFRNTKRYRKALQYYNTVIRIDATNLLALLYIRRVLVDLRRDNEAEACLDKIMKIIVDRRDLILPVWQKNYIINLCNQVLEIWPKYIEAWTRKGEALLAGENYDAANSCFDEALKLEPNPKDAWLWKCKGTCLFWLGNYRGALEYFEKYLKMKPINISALIEAGNASLYIGEYVDAVHYFDRVLITQSRFSPEFGEILIGKGQAHACLRQYEQARGCFKKAVEIYPQYSTPWYYKALTEDELGLLADASHSYKRFLTHASGEEAELIEQTRRRLIELGS
jgi:tetratricopeptide (TPR) repeat protein